MVLKEGLGNTRSASLLKKRLKTSVLYMCVNIYYKSVIVCATAPCVYVCVCVYISV